MALSDPEGAQRDSGSPKAAQSLLVLSPQLMPFLVQAGPCFMMTTTSRCRSRWRVLRCRPSSVSCSRRRPLRARSSRKARQQQPRQWRAAPAVQRVASGRLGSSREARRQRWPARPRQLRLAGGGSRAPLRHHRALLPQQAQQAQRARRHTQPLQAPTWQPRRSRSRSRRRRRPSLAPLLLLWPGLPAQPLQLGHLRQRLLLPHPPLPRLQRRRRQQPSQQQAWRQLQVSQPSAL